MLSEWLLAAGMSAAPAFRKVEITLPASSELFPPAEGSSLADEQCLTCHSVEMVLQQPPLARDEWTTIIRKMRDVHGAPLDEAQIAPLAGYLEGLGSRRTEK